jgi:hypothetical protein
MVAGTGRSSAKRMYHVQKLKRCFFAFFVIFATIWIPRFGATASDETRR